MNSPSRPRIQLCGRFVVELDGCRLDHKLPSRQSRLLFAYLALNRERAVSRDELAEALRPRALPAAAPSALTVLLSKLRAVVGPELSGRGELRLVSPRLPAAERAGQGNIAEAMHVYDSARSVLREELGNTPARRSSMRTHAC